MGPYPLYNASNPQRAERNTIDKLTGIVFKNVVVDVAAGALVQGETCIAGVSDGVTGYRRAVA